MGEIAALLTSLCWTFNTIQFTFAGRRVGSEVVNRMRLILAVLFLSLAHLLLYGQFWPAQAEISHFGLLGLSGVLGLVLADGSLFRAFLLIGPRLATVIQTLVPVFSTLLAWVWLGERLKSAEVGAILVTVTGVAWVVSEKKRKQRVATPAVDQRQYLLGLLLSVTSALGQALGLVIAKPVLADGFPSLSATWIRMVVAATAIWLFALIRDQVGATWRALRDRRALRLIAAGAVVGPFIGVWLSLVAVQLAPVGIASTLMGLSPIFIIPLAHFFFQERITPRAVVGTAIALVGAAVIFLV